MLLFKWVCFFHLAEWTESGGEKTFVHTPSQFFQGMAVGLLVAAIVPTIVAGLIGYAILGLRGHYFAICTLGLGCSCRRNFWWNRNYWSWSRIYNSSFSRSWRSRS